MVHRNVVIAASPSSSAGSPPPSAEASSETQEAVKSILNSRKCWRSIKGKEEPVWPPELEAALIEGLERYKPAESKSTRTLGRFPMRNKFVADFIFETTKVRRTPKQVGSRIQQLRDTNSGKQILKAISDRHYEMMHPKRAGPSSPTLARSNTTPSSRASTATAATMTPREYAPQTAPGPSHVYVQVLPACAGWTDQYSYPPMLVDLYSQDPRPVRMIDPTVTFTSAFQTPCHAVYTVYRGNHLVHREAAAVAMAPASGPSAGRWAYTTTLVPRFWQTLSDCDDPTPYTIHQEVVRLPQGSAPLMSVYYHFVNAALSTPPLSPRSSCGDSETDVTSLSRSSSPNLGTFPLDVVDVKPECLDTGVFGLKTAAVSGGYAPFQFDASPAPSLLDLPWGTTAYTGYDDGAGPRSDVVPLACELGDSEQTLWEPYMFH